MGCNRLPANENGLQNATPRISSCDRSIDAPALATITTEQRLRVSLAICVTALQQQVSSIPCNTVLGQLLVLRVCSIDVRDGQLQQCR
jgi:hypothetical protein